MHFRTARQRLGKDLACTRRRHADTTAQGDQTKSFGNSSDEVNVLLALVRYTQIQMPRRLLALALTFGVLGAPVASEICRAFCGMENADSVARGVSSHHQGSADSHDQASHHHHSTDAQPLSTSAAMNPVTHACDEVASLVMEVRAGVRAPVATAVPSPAFALVLVHASATSDVDSRHGPPGAVRSIAPLRI